MAKIPTYESGANLRPTPLDPQTASSGGRNMSAFGEEVGSIGETLGKLRDKTETLKAESYLAQKHQENYKLAATDPDVFNLEDKVQTGTEESINDAAEMIQNPQARDLFKQKATLDMERRNVPVMNTIYRRQSQDFKGSLLDANDQDIKEYQSLADPKERSLIKQKIVDRTKEAMDNGYIHKDWGVKYLDSTLKQADLDQVKSDMAINAEASYEQLQKGKDGLYPDISEPARKKFSDEAKKMIAKQGQEKNHIFSIAQNQAESSLIDKLAHNQLSQEDINNGQLMGINGVKVRPEFAKAATEALQDPFPLDSNPEKYNKLVNEIQDETKDPFEVKLDILSSRGITPQQKAHLISAHLREDPIEGKQSLNTLIQDGIQKNKQEIMEADKKLKKELKDRQSVMRKVTGMFSDHAKDEAHLADLQQTYYDRVQKAKTMDERIDMANELLNQDTLKINPKIRASDPNGTIFRDKITNTKRRYFPSGRWEPVE